jgi:hypothetical protein
VIRVTRRTERIEKDAPVLARGLPFLALAMLLFEEGVSTADTQMIREFTDAAGVSWRVWDVYPLSSTATGRADYPSIAFAPTDLTKGWLCFQSAAEKRRLAPIPPEWEVCDCSVLEDLCSRAGYVTRGPDEDRPT